MPIKNDEIWHFKTALILFIKPIPQLSCKIPFPILTDGN